jgi:hypothetical protein
VRAIQHTHFCAKNAKIDLNPTDLEKRSFCFETEGVHSHNKARVAFANLQCNIYKNWIENWTFCDLVMVSESACLLIFL